MTFEEMCAHHGWEPKAVKAILRLGKEVGFTVEAKKPDHKQQVANMKEFLDWYINKFTCEPKKGNL